MQCWHLDACADFSILVCICVECKCWALGSVKYRQGKVCLLQFNIITMTAGCVSSSLKMPQLASFLPHACDQSRVLFPRKKMLLQHFACFLNCQFSFQHLDLVAACVVSVNILWHQFSAERRFCSHETGAKVYTGNVAVFSVRLSSVLDDRVAPSASWNAPAKWAVSWKSLTDS